MCGIAGLLGSNPGMQARLVAAMTDRLKHRGPDDRGQWSDEAAGIALGHRRLAVVDLSPAGHQPMKSADGRWILTYNGEIYNHLALRADLEASGAAPSWRGHSDSESLLSAITAWGVERALQSAEGMFAFALWDRERRELTLARDRFGEKPLYYARFGGTLAFASELKALRLLPGFDETIDPQALRAMLGSGYVPPDRSIFVAAAQVPPGCRLTVDRDGQSLALSRYFDYPALVATGAADPIKDEGEAIDLLRETLGGAVQRQLAADVPVGTLLSGGIDSSLITALAVERAGARVRSFSIGFAEAGYDEAPHARAIAAHLGTAHNELYVTAADVLAVIPALPEIWDEPFGDSSQIPTHLVARFAREQVTVALSGDGGDELFGGYRRHIALPVLSRRLAALPGPLRNAGLGAVAAVPPAWWGTLARWRDGTPRPPFFGHKVRRAMRTAQGGSELAGLYDRFLDDWSDVPPPLADKAEPYRTAFPQAIADPAARIMLADALGYLPGDILTKVDRAAMAVSLEGRVPFLDPQVAALAARIPMGMKIGGGAGKLILRRLLGEYVPAALIDRPKAGFAMPLGAWLKGPLREWSEDLLSPAALAEDGLLDPTAIGARWAAHIAGREDASQPLWSILMFQAWRRAGIGNILKASATPLAMVAT